MRKFEEKSKFFIKFFNFRAGHKIVIMRKIKNLIWTCYNGGLRGGDPRGRKNFRKFIEIGNVKFNNFSKIALIFARSWTKI